ncbi:MAG: hypothetical protein Ct9H300mP20_17420 [Gammaproteobacteria bacterium]|nr:MAG: hypothetical protein Ct9H300mP20_17420 [Gammaproteobacteria bacterium]
MGRFKIDRGGVYACSRGICWVQKEQSGCFPLTNDVNLGSRRRRLLGKGEVDRGAFACMFGGKRKYPFISTAKDSTEELA